ncbi:MAG TPA: hypothetical protein VMY87_01340 [Armatimonadota bacterium]|nr:hypothetical protein [Armatimonadota bacterium]
MRSSITLAVACVLVFFFVVGGQALAGEPGQVQKKAAGQAAPAPVAPAAGASAVDTATLAERVVALERENLVLREDLGKARLDVRTGMNELEKQRAEDAARFQQKIDALNAELQAEREKQARRNRNLWLAIGVVAIGVIAAN